jgi:hypothetical protein
MADIAASNVTHTLVGGTQRRKSGRYEAVFSVVFGNGTLTYPSGGIPLTKSKLGCPSDLEELVIMDGSNGDGYVYKWDRTNNKIRIYQSPVRTHAHDILIKGGQIASTTNDIAHYGTDILGKEAATDATIAKAASATKGGVMSETLAAAALAELGNVAVAATTLKVKVSGW